MIVHKGFAKCWLTGHGTPLLCNPSEIRPWWCRRNIPTRTFEWVWKVRHGHPKLLLFFFGSNLAVKQKNYTWLNWHKQGWIRGSEKRVSNKHWEGSYFYKKMKGCEIEVVYKCWFPYHGFVYYFMFLVMYPSNNT